MLVVLNLEGQTVMQERLQRFGGWLAGMVIPNIGAFIAWGLITALVIPTGWLAELGFGGEPSAHLVPAR